MPSETKLNMTDISNYYVNEIMKNGWAKSKSRAKDILIEALCRNVVMNEVVDMCHFIADEDGFFVEQEQEQGAYDGR